jgi:hypothetical protein
VSGPSGAEVATPEPSSVESGVSTVPPVVQLPLVKKVKVTVPVGVPVGVPVDPVTVAWSVTDVPAAIDVTVAPFCLIAVTVVLASLVIVTCAEAVASSCAELHPSVVTLQVSVHVRSAVSGRVCVVFRL